MVITFVLNVVTFSYVDSQVYGSLGESSGLGGAYIGNN